MATAKKAPIKKAPIKKAAVKKVAVKKATAKKAAVKKTPVKKATVTKAPVKKAAVKKAPVKRVVVKKAVTQVATPKEVTVVEQQVVDTPNVEISLAETVKLSPKKSKKGTWILATGLILLILISILTKEDSKPSAAKKPENTSTASPAVKESQSVLSLRGEYTPTGGKLTWIEPEKKEQVIKYLIQVQYGNDGFATIATVDAGSTSFELMKIDTRILFNVFSSSLN